MVEALAAIHASGDKLSETYHLTLLAEAYQSIERPEDGLTMLEEALAHVEKRGERFWEAEIYRLKGELLLTLEGAGRSRTVIEGMSDVDSPEGCFRTAIAIAAHNI